MPILYSLTVFIFTIHTPDEFANIFPSLQFTFLASWRINKATIYLYYHVSHLLSSICFPRQSKRPSNYKGLIRMLRKVRLTRKFQSYMDEKAELASSRNTWASFAFRAYFRPRGSTREECASWLVRVAGIRALDSRRSENRPRSSPPTHTADYAYRWNACTVENAVHPIFLSVSPYSSTLSPTKADLANGERNHVPTIGDWWIWESLIKYAISFLLTGTTLLIQSLWNCRSDTILEKYLFLQIL